MDSDKYNQILQIARLYYIDKIPQNKIAEQEGLSKAKVNRLIKKAHELDFIKITVEPPEGFSKKLEDSIKYLNNLKNIKIISRDQKTNEEIIDCLNNELLKDLESLLEDGDILALSWNPRQYSLLESLADSEISFNNNLSIDEINSSLVPTPYGQNSTDFLFKLSELLKAQSFQICSPLYVDEKRTAHLLKQDIPIEGVLDNAANCNAAILSIEPITEEVLLEIGLNEKDLVRLSRKEPVGLFCGHIINKKGKVIDNVIDQREIGLSLSQIKALPNKMLISYNIQEAGIIKALLQAQLIDYLYISDEVADRIN